MSDNDQNAKVQPSHRISFSEKQVDGRGYEKLGAPVEVATVWPRKNGKQGGIIQWHISPDKLNDGVYFMLDNERQQNQNQTQQRQPDAFDQTESRSPERGTDRSR